MLPSQCRMARAALNWETSKLADAAKISVEEVKRFEAGGRLEQTIVEALRTALETAGIKFISDNETSAAGGPGLRLLKSPGEFDTDQTQTVQYPEHLALDAPTGAGG